MQNFGRFPPPSRACSNSFRQAFALRRPARHIQAIPPTIQPSPTGMVPRADVAVRRREVREFGAARAALQAHPALEGVGGRGGKELAEPDPDVRLLLRAHFDVLVRSQLGARVPERERRAFTSKVEPPRRAERKAERDLARERQCTPAERVEAFAARTRDRKAFEEMLKAYPVRSLPFVPGAEKAEDAMVQTRNVLTRSHACTAAAAGSVVVDPAGVNSAGIELGPKRLRSGRVAETVGAGASKSLGASARGVAVGDAVGSTGAGADAAAGAAKVSPTRRSRRKSRSVSGIENGALMGIREGRVSKSSAGAMGTAASRSRRTGPSACCLCPDPSVFGGVEMVSELTGPYVNKKGRPCLRVHFECACWAPQIYIDQATQKFCQVCDEYSRGRHLRCAGCSGRGATVGCYVEKCKKTFHFRCLDRAGARRVNQHFVAFCANHKHLADVNSYKLMIEAASIADVASVVGRDSTYGLDTPHARYTMLRRSQSELIFSARAQIASHQGVYDSMKVVFATKRRDVVHPQERLLVKDRPRRIRVSALDVANGRLLHLAQQRLKPRSTNPGSTSLGGAHDGDIGLEDEKVAKKAGTYVPIFLLRNLERAPDYGVDDIRLVKVNASVGRRGAATPSPGAKRLRINGQHHDRPPAKRRQLGQGIYVGVDKVTSPKSKGLPRAPGSSDGQTGGSAQRPRASVPLSVANDSILDQLGRGKPEGQVGDRLDEGETSKTGGEKVIVMRLALKEAGIGAVADRRAQLEHKRREREERALRRKVKEKEMRKIREAASARLRASGEADLAAFSSGAAREYVSKAKTAWDIFLTEELPLERKKRPEDTEDQAKRNMARMWGLMSRLERAVYEEKSRQALRGIEASGTLSSHASNPAVAAAVEVAKAAAAATRIVRGPPPSSAVRSPRVLGPRNVGPTARAAKGRSPASHLTSSPASDFNDEGDTPSIGVKDGSKEALIDAEEPFEIGLFCKTSRLPNRDMGDGAFCKTAQFTSKPKDARGGSKTPTKSSGGPSVSVGLPSRACKKPDRGSATKTNGQDVLDGLFPTSLDP